MKSAFRAKAPQSCLKLVRVLEIALLRKVQVIPHLAVSARAHVPLSIVNSLSSKSTGHRLQVKDKGLGTDPV